MNEAESDIKKRQEAEVGRFEDDLKAWEWCYERFKSKIDKIVEYERKVEKLEAELEDRDRLIKSRFREEKNKLLTLMGFFAVASLIFVKITSQSENVWAYFIAGLLIGVGWTVIFNLLLKSRN